MVMLLDPAVAVLADVRTRAAGQAHLAALHLCAAARRQSDAHDLVTDAAALTARAGRYVNLKNLFIYFFPISLLVILVFRFIFLSIYLPEYFIIYCYLLFVLETS